MFNWTTTRIINAKPSTGTLDEQVIKYDSTAEMLRIARDFTFEKKYIKSLYVAKPIDAELTEVTINISHYLTALQAAAPAGGSVTASLNFYIQLEGSEESIYANDWYKKGKPFSIGFKVTSSTTVSDIQTEIKNAVKKYALALYGRDLFSIVDYGSTGLTIKGTHEFQRIVSVSITIDTPFETEKIASWEYGDGTTGSFVTSATYGKNAFGSYNYMVRNLRVPSAENTKFYKLHADETPVVGAKYTQFILTYCAPSMAKPSLAIIGHEGMSTTTHVFWVQGDYTENGTAAKEFADKITASGITLTQTTPATHVNEYVAPSIEDRVAALESNS